MIRTIRILFLAIMLFGIACGVSAASNLPSGAKGPPAEENVTLIPNTDNFSTPDPSYYNWETDGILGTAVGTLANMIMTNAAFTLKISIVIMDFGLHPTWLNGTIDEISKTATSNGWIFVQMLWPFIITGAFILFTKDYMSGSYANILKRGSSFIVSLAVIAILFAVPSTTITKTLGAVTDLGSWASGKMLSTFTNDENADVQTGYIYKAIWEQIIDRSMSYGEFGSEVIKIDAESATKINSKISPYAVVEGMKWVDAILMFASDSDERMDIIDIYADKYENQYEQAKSPYWRYVLSLVTVVASTFASIYLLGMGIIMFILMIYLIGMILASVLFLPLTLIPSKEPMMLMQFLQKLVGVFTATVFVFLYISFTFIITNLVLKMDGLPFIIRMMLPPVVFVASFIYFFILLSKLQKVPALKQMSSVMQPYTNAGKKVKSTAKRYVKRKVRRKMNESRRNRRRGHTDRSNNYIERDEEEYDEDGYDDDGYDEDGYDEAGYDQDGYDEDGYDQEGNSREDYESEDAEGNDDQVRRNKKRSRTDRTEESRYPDPQPSYNQTDDQSSEDVNPDYVPAVAPGTANQQSLWGTIPPPRVKVDSEAEESDVTPSTAPTDTTTQGNTDSHTIPMNHDRTDEVHPTVGDYSKKNQEENDSSDKSNKPSVTQAEAAEIWNAVQQARINHERIDGTKKEDKDQSQSDVQKINRDRTEKDDSVATSSNESSLSDAKDEINPVVTSDNTATVATENTNRSMPTVTPSVPNKNSEEQNDLVEAPESSLRRSSRSTHQDNHGEEELAGKGAERSRKADRADGQENSKTASNDSELNDELKANIRSLEHTVEQMNNSTNNRMDNLTQRVEADIQASGTVLQSMDDTENELKERINSSNTEVLNKVDQQNQATETNQNNIVDKIKREMPSFIRSDKVNTPSEELPQETKKTSRSDVDKTE